MRLQRLWVLLLASLLLLSSAQAALCVRMEDSSALLSEDGQELVPPGLFDEIVRLSDTRFAARRGGKWALLDERGELLGDQVYDELRMQDGVLIARMNDGLCMLSADGQALTPCSYRALVPTGEGGCWGLLKEEEEQASQLHRIDAQGVSSACALTLRAISECGSEGLLAVQTSTGSWGYCDAACQLLIPARYEYAGRFMQGRAVVVRGGKYGAIDAQGRDTVAPSYDLLELSPSGLMIAVRMREIACVIDRSGAVLASLEGEAVHAALVGDYALLVDNERMLVYDAQAALVLELAPSDSVAPGLDGQLILCAGMWGEKCVSLWESDVYYQNLYALGRAHAEPVYACMSADAARYFNDLLGEIQISVDMDSARYGVVDRDGHIRLPCIYKQLEWLADNRFWVKTDTSWQMIDINGKVYCSYDAAAQADEAL